MEKNSNSKDYNSNSKDKIISGNIKQRNDEVPLKKRFLASALCGLLISFTVFIYGVLEIYLNNSEQFSFYLKDFVSYILFYGLLVFAFITLFVPIFKGKSFYIVLAIFFWLGVMLYIQGNFLNFGVSSLMGDDLQEGPTMLTLVINLLIWVITCVAAILFTLRFKNKKLLYNVFTVVTAIIIGMQLVSFIITLAPKAYADGREPDKTEETTNEDGETEPKEKAKTVLTTKGMFEVSKKRNIIIFIFDRFDAVYYEELLQDDPDFVKPLDGFTYYSDYTTLYCRTYPAITSIITGMTNDFSGPAVDWFNTAYTQSKFLKDLKANNYKIKLYTTSYYAYRDNTNLSDIADNEFSSINYVILDADILAFKMLGLSAYRYLPTALKESIRLTSASFSGHVVHSSQYPKYEKNDAKFYQELVQNGLAVQSDNSNNYIFIHLNGAHPPYLIDEDGNTPEEEDTSRDARISALKGCFNFVYEYIDNLKELGLYERSTIIITGDHAAARSDTKDVYNPRITSLFVKYSGEAGTELRYSDIPVSQDSLIATLVESEGIQTNNDYGRSFKDFKESEKDTIVRRYFFQKSSVPSGNDEIIEYKITGSGWDFDNWEIVKRTNIGRIYK